MGAVCSFGNTIEGRTSESPLNSAGPGEFNPTPVMQSKKEDINEVLNLFNSKNFGLAETKIKNLITKLNELINMV